MSNIDFNTPVVTELEHRYVREALLSAKHAGDGPFTKRCQRFFEDRYGFAKTLLTTSCTDALELCALLLDIVPGDEIILPSFTFVSSANAFALRGATLVFADSEPDHPNISIDAVAALITPKTKAIVVVHYAGVACDMDPLIALAEPRGIAIVEDAAQAVDSFYKGRPLGGIGTLGAFSFHETKNVSSGEGGLFVTNNPRFIERAEIIREKGTNRSAFFRGEVNKYGWVELGSSFLASDITAAYLAGQLERINTIQDRRKTIWQSYNSRLAEVESYGVSLPNIPDHSTNNAHMFYLVCGDLEQRTGLLNDLRGHGIGATFHYLSLHSSPYFDALHDGRTLPNSDRYTDCLLRLPLHLGLSDDDVAFVAETVTKSLAA